MDTHRKIVTRRIVLWFLGLLIALGVWLYAPPLEMLILTRREIRNSPEVWVVPKPLPDTAISQSVGRLFSYAGYEFEAPWTEVKVEKKGDRFGMVHFSAGVTIVLFNESLGEAEFEKSNKSGIAAKTIFGYQVRSAMLNTTPTDLRILSGRHDMVRCAVFLRLKAGELPPGVGHIYSFQTEWARGFEVGDLSAGKTVEIDAFDLDDNMVRLLITVAPGAKQPTQEEMNRVIFTLRPVPAPSSEEMPAVPS